jgi:neutral ceramidase
MLPRRDLLRTLLGLPLVARAAGSAAAPQRAAGVPAGALRVGAARIDITPDKPVCLEGYLEPATRVSTGVHDRLYARAFAFSDDRSRLVLVSCDLGSFTLGDFLRRRIGDALGLRSDELLLCATHTHSGPFLTLHPSYPDNVEYTRRLARPLIEAVDGALGARRPARLSVGRGRSAVGVSRRKLLGDGRVEMAPNPDGIADPEVLVLRATGRDGKPIAALFDYACHSRSLRSPNRLISGDVLGIAEQEAEESLGGLIVGAFAGASGDIDPVSVVDGFESTGPAPPETVRLGRQLGQEVVAAAKRTQDRTSTAGVRTRFARVPLPPRSPGVAKSIDVAACAVGDVAFVGLDCEASVEIGLAIKSASPFPATLVVTNCNGWAGYLPVAHQYAEGGYEVGHTGFGPEAAALLVGRVTDLLERL